MQYRRREIGIILPGDSLLKDFSIERNLMLPLLNLGLKRSAAQQRVHEEVQSLEQPELMSGLRMRPMSLASGQRQRFTILRSLIHGPKVILADEPFSHLDPVNAFERMNWLQKWQEKHPSSTIVMVSHHWSEALHWADRTLLFPHDQRSPLGPIESSELPDVDSAKRLMEKCVGSTCH